MSSATSLMYWEGKHAKSQPRKLEFWYEKTAGGIVALQAGYPVLSSDAAITQASIDEHLGTSSEFTAAQFDATAMGVDAYGLVVRMGDVDTARGQAAAGLTAKGTLIEAGAATADSEVKAGTLSDSTLESGYALGASGNLAARFVLTGLDAAANGSLIKIELNWISK